MLYLHFVDKLLPSEHLAVEDRPRHFCEDNFFPKVVGFTDQDAARLRQAFEDERGRHHWIAGEMIAKVVLGQAEVFHRSRRFATLEVYKAINPDPAHVASTSPAGA